MLRQLGWIVVAVRSAANQGATAVELELLKGTSRVVFQPIQAGGPLNGCSRVFNATTEDHACRQGALVILTGSVA